MNNDQKDQNGQRPVPPAGWQFNPDDDKSAQSVQQPIQQPPFQTLEEHTPSTLMSPTISNDSNRADETAPGPAQAIASPTAIVDQQVDEAQPDAVEAPAPSQVSSHPDNLQWVASDAVSRRQKPAGWNTMLIAGAVILTGLVYLITRDLVSAGSIVVAALLYMVFNARKPQSLSYKLDASGITISHKHYAFGQFRSFTIVQEESISSILLMPLKRFMPPLTVHYGPELTDDVVSLLADHLPMEAYRRDAVDALIHKLRF